MIQSKPKTTNQTRLFREVTLMLGGVFAVQGTDDETIRRVIVGLERIYLRHRQSATPSANYPSLAPHPAVASFLKLITDEGEKS